MTFSSAKEKISWVNELSALPEESVLVEGDRFSCYLAHRREIPNLLNEIGRLRELTFSLVGEGTGQEIDTDHYDDVYHQLFVWDKQAQEIAGAYRIAFIDKVIETKGVSGLYSSTVFEYADQFLDFMGNAIELGRSFVAPKYQNQMRTLGLLWQGIGQVAVRKPQYHKLFGAVSISDDYKSASKDLMVDYLNANHTHPEVAKFVTGKKPYLTSHSEEFSGTTKELSKQIVSIEPDGKGVPILLKHYLRMNANLLSFSIDENFSDALHALVVVDLLKSPENLIERYLTKNGADSFYQYHKHQASDSLM